jgi:hypothetical protein
VTTDPEELDPELDAELVVDDDLDDDLEDDLADGFVVEGDDDDEDSDDDAPAEADDGDTDEGSTVAVILAAEEPDEFEEEIAPVVRVPEDEDDAPGRQAGEFICTRCFMVKKESQLAVRSRKVCRDCA